MCSQQMNESDTIIDSNLKSKCYLSNMWALTALLILAQFDPLISSERWNLRNRGQGDTHA